MESKYNYFKRDISWLSFNYRVLLEALDEHLPLYERINFIHEFAGGLYGFFIALRCAGCHGLVVRHPDFVKLFQIGRVDGDEIDALV